MRELSCAATLRSLQAFHDQELDVGDQIAVDAHLEWCAACAAELAELRVVRAFMRATAPGRTACASEDAASFPQSIVSRMSAEREVSVVARVGRMVEDVHLVYAGLGAVAAALACVVIMSGMMRFATSERPDSLAAIANMLATPGSNENPVAIDGHVRMPRALDSAFSAVDDDHEADAVFTLAAVVTREGRIANLELLHAKSCQSANDEAKLVVALLDAVSRARFEPARVAGLPVAVNMVWLVARTTVRGNKHPLEIPVNPPAKKRVV